MAFILKDRQTIIDFVTGLAFLGTGGGGGRLEDGRSTMMMLRHVALLVIIVAVVLSAPPAFACQAAGPNAHIGTVTAVDGEKKTLSLKDAESGMELTFVAAPELLKTVKVNDEVTVKYKPEGKALRATSITKG